MKKSERLLRMLLDLGVELPEGTRLERAAGSWYGDNRTQGAWIWTAVDIRGVPVLTDPGGHRGMVGSQWTMTQLVRTGIQVSTDSSGDLQIDPVDEAQERISREARERRVRAKECGRCSNVLTKQEIPPVGEQGPEWCWTCCEKATENGEMDGLSTYAVAVIGYG